MRASQGAVKQCQNYEGQNDILFLDFSKAFGAMPQRWLLVKLQHYSIDDETSNWIASLLRGVDKEWLLMELALPGH